MNYEKFTGFLDENKISFARSQPLCEHSSFKIGGNARITVSPTDELALTGSVCAAREYGIPYIVIGMGSNVLFDDNGYEGAVIFTTSLKDISVRGDCIVAGAGAALSQMAICARDRSLHGLEFAYGIPGSCGGAVYMNAGAFNGDMSGVVLSSRCYLPEENRITELTADDHKFGYRHSVYADNNNIILGATLKLTMGDRESISRLMEDYISRRIDKQPLQYPSAGSVFKRRDGYYIGKLIDEAGLKGLRVGGAAVSEKHAGFIVNLGGATSRDVLELIGMIKKRIFKAFSVELECEIKYIPPRGN